MRVPGYCDRCRKFRNRVNVSGSQLVKGAATGTAPIGTCSDCEQDDERLRALAYRERMS